MVTSPAASEQASRRHRQIFEEMAQGVICVAPPDGRIVEVNPAAEQLMGQTRTQLLGLAADTLPWEAIHEDGAPFPVAERPIMVALRTWRPVRGVVAGVRLRGEPALRWLLMSATPLFREGEASPFEVFTTFSDVTERSRQKAEELLRLREANDAVQASERRYRQIIETSGEGIWRVDAAGKTEFINPPGAALLGYAPSEMMGRSPLDFVFPEDRAGAEQALQANLAGDRRTHVFRMRRKDGDEVLLLTSLAPFFDDHGRPAGALSMFTDVTAREHSRTELEVLVRELRDALAHVDLLRGLLPVCAWCKKIRDDDGYWSQLETYLTRHTGATFSHGICPECEAKQALGPSGSPARGGDDDEGPPGT